MSASSKKKHMDVFLQEVFNQFIAIKDNDYRKSQVVFNGVFEQVKQKMCEQDNFFSKYGTQVLYAGSVYDGVKIGKLDEFDMDIVIRLPISYEDGDNGIIIENHQPGFVKLKITNAFDHMDKQQDWEKYNKVTRDWRDGDKYFLQSRFRQWLHGIVQRAVNELNGKVVVDGVTYILMYRESGPAFTLNVRNDVDCEEFVLDVDLVPVIRFMTPRWPEGYRTIDDEDKKKEWLVVPKPLKCLGDHTAKSRCWRLAFHNFERDMLKGNQQLKVIVRMVKKLRDSLGMKKIASYYIKTLFLWEINEKDKKYWQDKISILFRAMVEKLHNALQKGVIPYYWHQGHNLIKDIKPTVLKVYNDKVTDFLNKFNNNDVDAVVELLLGPDDFEEFKKTEFYKSFSSNVGPPALDLSLKRTESLSSVSSTDNPTKPLSEICTADLLKDILASQRRLESKLDSINQKIENKFAKLNERIDKLYDCIGTGNKTDSQSVFESDDSNDSAIRDMKSNCLHTIQPL